MHRGETLLARAIRLAKEAGFPPIVVVLGSEHERIRATVSTSGSIIVINDRWDQGISTSIQTGLDASDRTDPLTQGALILTCDQPRLQADHLRALKANFLAQLQPTIVASSYAEVLGIPAIFPRLVFSQLHALRGDKGARSLLTAPPCALASVPFPGGEVDIDEPDDLTQLA
jgi:CTP:molybdopterin cytidylyltransferase MocA